MAETAYDGNAAAEAARRQAEAERKRREAAQRRAARARAEAQRRAAAAARRRARQAALRRAAAARARARAAAERRARAEAARRAAEAAAAAARKIAEARSKAYAALSAKQSELVRRAGVVRDATKPPTVANDSRASLFAEQKARRERQAAEAAKSRAAQSAAAQAARARAVAESAAAIAARSKERAYFEEKQRLTGTGFTPIGAGIPVLKPTGSGVKTARDAKSAEALIREELARAGLGKASRTDDIVQLQKVYEQYSQGVYDKYRRDVAKLNQLLADAGNRKLSAKERESAWKRARTMYYSSSFRGSSAEFARLFGDGTKQGTYTDFYKTADKISAAQREWWKRQMKAQLSSQLVQLRNERKSGDFSDELARKESTAKQTLAMLNGDVGALGQTIDHYETWTDASGREHSRPVYRTKTLEEALADQQARLIVEQEKQRAAFGASQFRNRLFGRKEGLVETPDGRYVDPDVEGFRQEMLKDAIDFYGKGEDGGPNLPSIKRSEDLQNIANDLLRQWEKRNPAPAYRPAGSAGPGSQGEELRRYQRWEAARREYERKLYEAFGSAVPGALERVFALPGISHGLAALQGGVSSIGAGARVANAAFFGETTVGGIHVSMGDLPPSLRSERDRWVAEQMKGKTEGYQREYRRRAQTDWYSQFIQSERGQKWQAAVFAQKKAQDAAEGREFVEGFYGTDDAADRLDALNKFGSEPFEDGTLNLLFQLLVDPTNAIPLKFTTYVARAKYAGELAQGASKLSPKTWLRSAKHFLAADEGILKLETRLRKFDDQLRKAGTDPEQAAEDLRRTLAGIKDATKMEAAFEEWARKIGLNPKEINEGQVFNLSEYYATKQAATEGNLFTNRHRIAKEFAAREAADKKAAAAAKAQQKMARTRVKEAGDRAVEAGREAQERLAIQRASDEAALKAKAEAGAGQPAAAASGPVGKAPAPAKPASVKPEPVSSPGAREPRIRSIQKKIEARVRHSANYKAYDGTAEYYTTDVAGNLVPKDRSILSAFTRTDEYRQLVKDAKKTGLDGDLARARLSYQAEKMRNVWRTSAEDARTVRDSRFTPGKFDVFERAGVLDDAAAAAILEDNLKAARELRKAGGRKQDSYVMGFSQEKGGRIVRGDATPDVEELPEFGLGDRIDTGNDVLLARDTSFRGLREVFQPFTHNSLQYYRKAKGPLGALMRNLMEPGWVAKVPDARAFRGLLDQVFLKERLGGGLSGWRDGGMAMFEIFHQLRLAGTPEAIAKLREFSAMVDLALVNKEDIFSWQWKVMEYRAGLDWALDRATVYAGFKDAAHLWGIDPDLALASIPNGYRAQRPALAFGLSPNLRPMAESTGWLPAPYAWTQKQAADMTTHIFTRGVGEPMQVVHYVATRFGDFVKGKPIMNRVMGELTHAVTGDLGIDEMISRLVPHMDGTALAEKVAERQAFLRSKYKVGPNADIVAIARRRGETMVTTEDFLRAELTKPQRQIAKTKSFLRPDYTGVYDGVWRAYWAGDLPLANPRAHELLYLIHMQDTGTRSAMVNQTRAFMRYMDAAGAGEEARELLRAIHAREFDNLSSRYVAENKVGAMSRDAITGEEVRVADSAEWQMWREMGFVPDDARLAAREEGLSRLRAEAINEERAAAKREAWLAEERQMPSDAYTGIVSEEQLDDLLLKVESAKDLNDVFGPVASIMKRLADNGGLLMSAADEGQIGRLIKALSDPERPGGLTLLRRIQDSIGDGVLTERLALAGEKLSYQEALLRVRLRVMEEAGGKVKPQFAKAHSQLQLELEKLLSLKSERGFQTVDPTDSSKTVTVRPGKSSRIDLDAMRAQYEAEAIVGDVPADVKITPATPPQTITAPTDGAAMLLERVSKMTEAEWYAYAKEQAWRTLRRRGASRDAKAAARTRIANIELAEYALKVDKQRGTHVEWRARASARDRVVGQYGKDAERMIAAKMIAPFATDLYGATVEQVRTWWGQLRRAPAETVPGATRLGMKHAEDFFPIELYDEVEQAVAESIHKARGYDADTLTPARRARKEIKDLENLEEPGTPRPSRAVDRDPLVLQAKQAVLNKYGIDMRAYDEARAVLRRGYVQRRTNQWMIHRANKIVARTGADFDKVYLAIRQKKAAEEARKQLGGLAFGELYGLTPQGVFDEFVVRYSPTGDLGIPNTPLTDFQLRTLENAVKARSGLDDLTEAGGMSGYLQSANRPPFEQGRTAVREWLVKHGQWSPRTAELFAIGKRSWSVAEESAYWYDNFGFLPDWANPALLEGDLNFIFHNDELYYAQMRAWGVLDRSMDLKLRLEGTDARAIERARVHGDPALNIPARRELEAQRLYVVERYGDLVGEVAGDGVKLTAMPWLMYPDEIVEYVAKRGAEGLPEGLVQNADELAELTKIIQEEMAPLMDELLSERQAAHRAAGGRGAPILYEDIYKVASEVQARILADPKWNKRLGGQSIGSLLDKWTGFNRWLVFSNPAFMVMNVVDVPIKGAWYRATRRGLFNPGLKGVPADVLRRAQELTPAHLGLDAQSTIYRLKQRKAADYLLNPRQKGLRGVLERAQAPFRAIPEAAGWAELGAKMELARGMYPQVYDRALKRLGDADLADVWAKNFIKEEIGRMWPVAGDGAFEQLFNRIVPFGSYMVKNKVLFLSEALAHPSVLNKIEYIGRAIEEHNLREWERDHPGEEMPSHLRRRIELPWAPDYYLDLGQFSDATRGLKPLYKWGEETTAIDFVSQWVRLINPGAQAGLYTITNAIGLTKRVQYIPILDANGFPTGEYRLVTVGWTEPWSNNQPGVQSVFWFAEAAQSALDFWDGGFTEGELSQLLGQVFLFNAIESYDRGTALFTFYKAMAAKDAESAQAWLDGTTEGATLKQWMAERSGRPRDVMDTLNDMMRDARIAPYRDWFALSPAERAAVVAGRDRIRAIRDAYAARLLVMDHTSAEFRETKAQMYYLINQEYLSNPALMKEEVWGKSAAEWAATTSDWQTDKLMDDYFALSDQRPQRANFDSSAKYNAALEKWQDAKALFLKTYPEVEKRLGTGILQIDSIRDKMNADWDAVLKRISRRNEQIELAKADVARFGYDTARGDAAQDKLDILYLQNDLDYTLLNKDYATSYFSPEDFNRLPFGVQGPPGLKSGISLPRFSVLADFSKARMDKAIREGRLDEFLAKEQYGKDMKAAILHAKGGDPFGEFDGAKFYSYIQSHPELREKYFDNNPGKRTQWEESARYVEGIRAAVAYARAGGGFDGGRFVAYLKARPSLLAAYFKRHPEKRAQWAANDAYIKHISVWGKLMRASRWDEAERVWSSLPQWVKDRYYAKHPERRKRAAETAQYLGYMKRWISLFEKGDSDGAMKYFRSLPKWARDRYYAKHPEKRAEFETSSKVWSKLTAYFAADAAGQAKYLAENPDLARWLAQNAGDEERKRFAILQAYKAIPKGEQWLRRVFREKYPEVFSAEALGERKLARVYRTLRDHPEISDEFEKWVEAIWATYAEMLKHTPRPVKSYFRADRKVPLRKFVKSLSAADSSR